jgi:drug/metabolite transporter (DMT)-like permease
MLYFVLAISHLLTQLDMASTITFLLVKKFARPRVTIISNAHSSTFKASPLAIWGGMLAIYVAWGSTYLAIRFADQSIPPFLMAGTRFLIAGSVLLVIRRLAGDPFPRRIEARSAAVAGLFLLLGGNGGVVWAEQTVPSGLAALMVSSSPLWMLLMDAFRPNGHKPNPRAIAGVAIGFAGVAVLFWPSGSGGLLDLAPIGAVVLIFATLAWAAGSVYSRNSPQPGSPLMGSALEMLAGGAALIVLSAVTGEFGRFHLAAVTTPSLLGLGYLIIFGSLVGFSAYTWLLQVAPISLVSTYAYVNPLVALVIGSLIGHEDLSPRTLLAAAVILASVALTTTGRSKVTKIEEVTPNE